MIGDEAGLARIHDWARSSSLRSSAMPQPWSLVPGAAASPPREYRPLRRTRSTCSS